MNAAMSQLVPVSWPIGEVIRVPAGFYFHVALMGDLIIAGERSVLAFSPDAGGLIEQPFLAFARGRPVTRIGYLGTLPPASVMSRARMMQGTRYSWTEFNCEHFVRYAHGVPVESPQLRFWAAVGMLGLFSLVKAKV
jgi:hypothetical protein